MKETLFIRLRDGAAPDDEVEWELAATPAASGRSRLAELAPRAAGRRLVVFVPGNTVLLAHPRLPTRKRQRMLQALPFALEEQLATDVDGLHFALGDERADGSVAAAAVGHDVMAGWLDQLRQAGLEPDVMAADCDALPTSHDRWTVLAEADRWLLRTPVAGYVIDAEAGPDVLGLAFAEAGEAMPDGLRLVDARPGDRLAPALTDAVLPEGVRLASEPLRGSVVGLLAAGATRAVNLLQGPYSRREALSRRWRPWRAAAAMAGVFLLLQAVLAVTSYRELQREQARLDEAIVAVYRDAFPDAQRVVNPRAQMEQRLAALRSGGDAGLAGLLGPVAPVLKGTTSLQIKGLRYRDNSLEVDITLGDLQALDRLKQALLGAGPLAVDIAGASAKEGRVEGRLIVRRAGA